LDPLETARIAGYTSPIGSAAKTIILVLLIAASVAAALLFRLVLHSEMVYSHFMYIPITLACMWWGVRGIAVAGALAALIIAFHAVGIAGESWWTDLARSGFFVAVAAVIGLMKERLEAGRRSLEQSERNYRTMIEKSIVGVLVHGEGKVLFANERFCRMLGWDEGALEGTSLSALAHSEDSERLLALDEREEGEGEVRLVRRDGRTVWVEASGSRVDYRGAPAVQVHAIDITSRLEAEQKRRELGELARKQEEQLEHSTRLAELGEMAAGISHELNQPLTGIRNYARNAFYMIEKKLGGDEEVKGNLRLISEQVDRASKIINQMRELTRRSDAGFSMLDINGVIRESIEFLLPQMRLSEVEVSVQLAEDLPQVWADRIRLAQVFLNLLSNARQAMESASTRRLSIRSRRDAGAQLPLVVDIADTGKGFTEEQARRLFQPFYTTRKGGHGLGLSISRAIMQDHRGSIEAAGVPGAGATFTIRLPAGPRRAEAGESPRSER
jgi:PAS domain S-box-containing protein